jgi:hypothetical protein
MLAARTDPLGSPRAELGDDFSARYPGGEQRAPRQRVDITQFLSQQARELVDAAALEAVSTRSADLDTEVAVTDEAAVWIAEQASSRSSAPGRCAGPSSGRSTTRWRGCCSTAAWSGDGGSPSASATAGWTSPSTSPRPPACEPHRRGDGLERPSCRGPP